MNWSSVTFDWNQVRAFLATAETGSLTAAARALGLTQPTLGRQVTGLEGSLGIVLFERVGRGLKLTPTGQGLLDHVRAMGEAASRISLAASGQNQAVEGRVRITASDVLSAYILPPVIARIRAAAPGLEIDVVAANDIRDLQQREADIAIRHQRPEQPELIARLVQTATARFYAATDYLARRGRPESAQDLRWHDFVGFGDTEVMIGHLKPLGFDLRAEQFRVGSASGLVAWEMAKHGLGIVIMSDEVAQQTPGMEPALPGMAPVSYPVWLTTHRELHTSRRIRLVFDILAEALAPGGAESAFP